MALDLNNPVVKEKAFNLGMLAVATAFTLASSAVGVEAYNDCERWGTEASKDSAKSEKNWFVGMIVITVLLVIASIAISVLKHTGKAQFAGLTGGVTNFIKKGGVWILLVMLFIQLINGAVGWTMINRCEDTSDESSTASQRKDFFIAVTFLSLGFMGIIATKKFFCKCPGGGAAAWGRRRR